MATSDLQSFSPDIPPNLEHAPLIREEALDWLETRYSGRQSFTTSEVLHMAGEPGRRWLIARLRQHDIGDDAEFSLPDAADALTVLFLRSKGVKFRDAVDAVTRPEEPSRSSEPRYGGLWNRLIVSNLERLRRRVPPRLLGAAVASLLPDPKDHSNCLIIIRRGGKPGLQEKASRVSHDYVYRSVLERPAPSCSVIAPSREVLFMARDQLPTRSELTSRNFVSVRIATGTDKYELLLGTMRPLSLQPDEETLSYAGRILDIVFTDFETFVKTQAAARTETPLEPESGRTGDLQLWLVSKLLQDIYPGSICEISEISKTSPHPTKVLASSAAEPWAPAPWEPAKSLEMLSGYASLTGVPLVVDKVEYPLTLAIESIEPELRFLKSQPQKAVQANSFSAMALPITSSSGESMGALYMLMPRPDPSRMDIEVRTLTIFSRIAGEIIERQRTAEYSARVAEETANARVLQQQEFRAALLDLLSRRAAELKGDLTAQRDIRMPFVLLSAYRPDPDEYDPAISGPLGDWLVHTLRHLEWRSFVRVHMGTDMEFDEDAFIGEVPGVGMMIALGELVSKDALDRIRGAFPTTINRASPTNSPVKLVAWVLDVPAQRILHAAEKHDVPSLADEIVRWASEVTALVDDVAQSAMLAHEQGQWEAAMHMIRQAMNKKGGQSNAYLRRLAADCCFSLGDWPGALRYAQEAARLSRDELGSGLVRSLCLEGDANLCLCNPVKAWDLYSEAASLSPGHPLPRYYRGQSLLLMARLLRVYEDERRRGGGMDREESERLDVRTNVLVDAAMEDLTSAADLLDHWGLIPESYQYRNFHLVPTLMGQGASYLLNRSPGPAASRLQSARRSFPKDDIFLREFLFAKCWEQGIHRRCAALLLGDGWGSLGERLLKTFRLSDSRPSEGPETRPARRPRKAN